jgi:hypothetical protein
MYTFIAYVKALSGNLLEDPFLILMLCSLSPKIFPKQATAKSFLVAIHGVSPGN